MAQQCLVTTLKGTINDDSFVKLGELKLKIAPNSSVAGNFAYINTRSLKYQKLKLSNGAYFCTSITDNTPSNTTKAESREVSLSATTTYNLYIYFDDDYAYLTVTDKYSIEGFGYVSGSGKDKRYILYDLDDVKYLTNWIRFTAPLTSTLSNPQDLPSKTILTSDKFIEGNLTGFTIGESLNPSTNIALSNITGTISSIIPTNGTTIIIAGTYYYTASNIDKHPVQYYLYSPNVTGDLGTWTDMPNYVQLGTTDNRCQVVCNSAIAAPASVATTVMIYANTITKTMFSNMVTNKISNDLRIWSTQLDVEDIKADSAIMTKVNAIIAAGGIVRVNNTLINNN